MTTTAILKTRAAVDITDFPAAHSTDSEWFAVDKEGRVAVFDTLEPGPLPNAGLMGQGAEYEAIDELVAYHLGRRPKAGMQTAEFVRPAS